MRVAKKNFILILFALLFPHCIFASPYYGATFSYVQIPKEPEFMYGYQFLVNYDPDCLKWRQFNLYFDGGFSHLWVTNWPHYRELNIYTLSPIVRYNFKKRGFISPYLEISIGLAYLNHTRLEDRKFGIHLAFQDRFGIGFYVGNKQQFSLGIHAVHYSNAHLASDNSGISIAMEIDIGYRFSR